MPDDDSPFVSPALAQFLSNRVHEVIATQSYGQQNWSRRRIASYITGSEEIAGTLSDATLGRLLDPAHPQRPKFATIEAVTEFLLHFRYITRAQLDWVEESLSIRSGLALDAFFDVPGTRARQQFLHELEGEYRAVEARDPFFFLHTRLHLTYLREIEMLAATEVISLYRPAKRPEPILPETLAGALFDRHLVARFTATGQALASADLIAIFFKAGIGGFDSIVNVATLFHSDEDEIEALRAGRNHGWKALSSRELDIAPPLRADAPARQTMQALSNDPQYSRYRPAEKLAGADAVEPESLHGPKDFVGAGRMRGDLEEIVEKLWAETENLEERLRIARDYGSWKHFEQALIDGADPNVIGNGHEVPYIMEFAQNGNLAWAQILLADPRCKLEPDAKGMTPSFYTGVLLRHIAETPGTEDLREEWGTLYRLLLAREQEQGCVMRPGPHAPEPGA